MKTVAAAAVTAMAFAASPAVAAPGGEFPDAFPSVRKAAWISPGHPATLRGPGGKARRKTATLDVFVDGVQRSLIGDTAHPRCHATVTVSTGVSIRLATCGRVLRADASASRGRHKVVVRWGLMP
jgi:hypothetical protein